MKHTQLGFTLMELMVTVAIVGILASIAIPSYQDSVKKSRRADAKAVLLGLANAMERHFTETNSYCDAGGTGGANTCFIGAAETNINETGTPDPDILKFTIPTETTSFYTITISAATAATYTLRAAATGAQAGDKCGNFILEHTGAKSVSTAATDCW